MKRKNDVIGRTFGDLYVLDDEPRSIKVGNSAHLTYHCKCKCGNERWYKRSDLVMGKRKSCGSCNRKNISQDSVHKLVAGIHRAPRNSKTGVTGVRRVSSGKFEAYFRYKGEFHHVGTFNSLEEARVARKNAIIELIG